MRPSRAVVAAALLCGVVACAPPTSPDDDGSATLPAADLSNVDVDTPQLARLKLQAGIADCPATDPRAEPAADGLPELTLPCLGGGRDVDLSALRGEPTVLTLWASWCDPCRAELPILQQLHETGKVRVLGVDIEDPQPASALELARDSGVTFPSLADPGAQTYEPLKVIGPPQTVFVSADGTVQDVVRGKFDSYDQLADLVSEHLEVPL